MPERPAKQALVQNHNIDDQDIPQGGITTARGLEINWQEGPLCANGVWQEANGAFVETVIEAAIGRLDAFQASKFNCPENEEAIQLLIAAIHVLNSRTTRRQAEGTEGTHEV